MHGRNSNNQSKLSIISKMNCKQCGADYSNSKEAIPRVLINCGHTLCEGCIEKSFEARQLSCPECGQVSYGISFHQYPVNATLISLLKEEAVCSVHNKKLEAYCEKDNELLCLNCVIGGQHKSHKISSVAEKVARDRAILKQCMRDVQDSLAEIQSVVGFSEEAIDRIESQYKDCLLEMGMLFSNAHQLLQQIQEKSQEKLKAQYEVQVQRYHRVIGQMKQKRQFMSQLSHMYEQVVALPNLQYLHQDNKRLFIMENCKLKKVKIEPSRIQFNKLVVLSDVAAAVQNMIGYQKKLQGEATPVLKAKKSNRSKEPTILEVNLNEQYKKHFKSSLQPTTTPSNVIAGTHPSSNICMHMKSKSGYRAEKVKSTNVSQNQVAKTPKQEKGSNKKQTVSICGASSQGNSNNDRINSSFHSECLPISMINSFMESNPSNHSLSIRGSEADFTMMSYQEKIFHFGGFNDSSVECWKVDDKGGKVLPNVNVERSKAQCAIIPSYSPHKCLIFGGKSTIDQKLDTFTEYDFQSMKWTTSLFKLSEAKSGFGSAIKQNRLYVAGGSNASKSLRTFQQYRVTPNSMVKTDLASMNHCRDQLGLVLGFDGYIYACGGINESGSVLSSCQRYNEAKIRWEAMPSMNRPRRSFTLVSLPHGIYAIGGYDGSDYLREVELFDFTQQKWIVVASMNEPRFAHTALVTNDMQNIIVSGGFYKKPLRSTQIFEIINQKWVQGAPLQTERFLHCSLIVNV